MNRIICLDPLVANQIAAGEVIERAASVVKEIVENSIDAKATKIEVEIEGSGIHLIRVRDNGHGIIKEDLPLAFCRHATSKIRTSNDLEEINSLGFRGEALASIASVSKCCLTSKVSHQETAWKIEIHPNFEAKMVPCSHAQGSTIEIRDLFFNTPVRRKFLRSEKTENAVIEETLKRLALSAPQVSMIFKQNEKVIRHYERAHDEMSLRSRVASIVGQSFMDNAKRIDINVGAMSLSGWIAHPTLQRRYADCQYFFVNGRSVKDRALSYAIRTLYQQHREYSEGTYPAYILFLTVEPSEVDVNVHPTKQEVRFSQSMRIYQFLAQAIEKNWNEEKDFTQLQKPLTTSLHLGKVSNERKVLPPSSNRYVLIEHDKGVQIIDLKRSKREIVLYYLEKQNRHFSQKPLLFPLNITLSFTHFSVKEWIMLLKDYGFECQEENHQVKILQQPILLDAINEEMLSIFLKAKDIKECQKMLVEILISNCSLKALNTLNFTEKEWMSFPSICLTHDTIEKALEV